MKPASTELPYESKCPLAVELVRVLQGTHPVERDVRSSFSDLDMIPVDREVAGVGYGNTTRVNALLLEHV